MLHAKALLFVDNQKAKIFEVHIRAKQTVCADGQIYRPRRNALGCLLVAHCPLKATKYRHLNREASESLAKSVEMLLR